MDTALNTYGASSVAMVRRKNTWYTIKDGNWSDPNIWMSNSRRRYSYPASVFGSSATGGGTANFTTMALYPSANDDVFINHNVVVDVSSVTNGIVLNNLYVSGNLSMATGASRGITVVGDLQVTGVLDMSAGNLAHNIALYGVNNFVNTLNTGTGSFISYLRVGDQSIMDLPYRHLQVGGLATKSLTNHLTVAGNLSTQWQINGGAQTLECGPYNLTVNGTANVTGTMLSKAGGGSMLFVGLCTFSASSSSFSGLSLTGNPSAEFRGGLTSSLGSAAVWNTGISLWSFTTNTQTVTINGMTHTWTAPISVVGAIAVSEAGTGIMVLNQPIDCTSVSGSVIGKGTIYFNATSSLPSFTTGTFDRTSFANTVGYTMPASITLPYTNYSSLLVSNSGTKTLLGNTTLLGNLVVSNAVTTKGALELAAYDLTVTGTTTVNQGTLKKSGSGNVLFIGQLNHTINGTQLLDFSGGNPNVELRGGVVVNYELNTWKTGTGTWTFTTNSQSISGYGQQWDSPIVVSGAITITLVQTSLSAMRIPTLNGTVAGSKFLMGTGASYSTLYFTTNAPIMPTGVFDHTTNPNVVGHEFDGDYTLPYSDYSGLFVGGAGTKTAAGSMNLSTTLAIGFPSSGNVTSSGACVLELGPFNLVVAGATSIGVNNATQSGSLSKTGAGSIIFIGNLFFTSQRAGLNLIGNPSVECRGGISIACGAASFTGSSEFTFTTNNQTFATSGQYSFPYNMLISGAITVTQGSPGSQGLTITGILNGNNAASTFDCRGTNNYQNAQCPMLTGVLQTNLAANTFIYNRAGDQDIKGGTYRTLTLAGSGIKTLTGNVIAATAYTLTAPATLNLNGFTRT